MNFHRDTKTGAFPLPRGRVNSSLGNLTPKEFKMKTQEQFASGTLFVVEDACTFGSDRAKGTIVIESTDDDFPRAIENLRSVDARNLAIGYAASHEGMGDPRINGNLIGPYAVNNKGVPVDKVMDDSQGKLPVDHPSLQPAAYRVEVPVTRPI
jgi:hypothetical protein